MSRRRRLSAIIVSLALLWARNAGGQAKEVVITDLGLDLVLDYDAATLSGTATIAVKNLGRTPARTIPLQLGRLLRVTAVSSAGGARVPFTQDVIGVTDWPVWQVNQVYLTADPALGAEESRSFVISYAGYLVGYTETGMQYVRDRVSREFTILREDALAFPRIRLPSVGETREMPQAEFTWRLRVTVPTGLVVAAAVPPKERRDTAGVSTWTFEGREPVPFLNVPIADYKLFEGPDLRIFHFPQDYGGARRLSDAIGKVTGLYSRWFGTIERRGPLTVMEIPEGWGSQAALTAGIIQTADAFNTTSGLAPVYHELAHLWHRTDTDAPPVRWNEGLATFLQYRVAEVLEGRSLDSAMVRLAERVRRRAAEDPEAAKVPMVEYGARRLTDLSYTVGALLFYGLYRTLGEREFDRILGAYGRRYHAVGSTTLEFVRFLRDSSRVDLRPVLDDWLSGSGGCRRLIGGERLDQIVAGYRRP
jgi:hypothetical protein